MLKIVATLLVFTNVLFSLDWAEDLETAFNLAKQEKKNVMVMVEGEHCRWCKKMKGRTLSDDNVEKKLKNFIIVKVMREDSKSMQQLPNVRGVPTIFFMKENKEVLEDIVGYFNVEDFMSYISDVEKKVAK